MKFYLGATDWRWYNYLRNRAPEDVNFWRPGGNTAFRALERGEPFLFKLKKPYNAIGGVGFFMAQSQLPLSLAWDTFKMRNGFDTLVDFRQVIQQYRGDKAPNPAIGCIALTNPIFFAQEDWITVPDNWSDSIVQGKTYTTTDSLGLALWQKVESTAARYLASVPVSNETFVVSESAPQYGASVLQKVRIGQGAFRISVTDAYTKRCAITGEKTLPVLEAAHIQPYASAGPNRTANGLLLRSDMHKLFDDGYLTITPDFKVEVSARIREEFNNGREYYQYHGKPLAVLPKPPDSRPGRIYLEYHNSVIYQG
jgi:putative restriction endonuclease